MISVDFLWFEYRTLKEWKTAKVQNHSGSAYNYLPKWLVHLNFDMFIAALFNFFMQDS